MVIRYQFTGSIDWQTFLYLTNISEKVQITISVKSTLFWFHQYCLIYANKTSFTMTYSELDLDTGFQEYVFLQKTEHSRYSMCNPHNLVSSSFLSPSWCMYVVTSDTTKEKVYCTKLKTQAVWIAMTEYPQISHL